MTKQLTESEQMRAILNTINEAPTDIVDVSFDPGLLDPPDLESIAHDFGGEFIWDDQGPTFRGQRSAVEAFATKVINKMNYSGEIENLDISIGPVDDSRKPYVEPEVDEYKYDFGVDDDHIDPEQIAHDIMTDPRELADVWSQIEYAISLRPEGDPYDAIASIAREYDLSNDIWVEVADHAADKIAGFGTVWGYWDYLHKEFGYNG